MLSKSSSVFVLSAVGGEVVHSVAGQKAREVDLGSSSGTSMRNGDGVGRGRGGWGAGQGGTPSAWRALRHGQAGQLLRGGEVL